MRPKMQHMQENVSGGHYVTRTGRAAQNICALMRADERAVASVSPRFSDVKAAVFPEFRKTAPL